MKISKNLKDFLENSDNQELLDNYKFEELYRKLPAQVEINTDIGAFTVLMYEIDIDPLIYLNMVPKYFLYSQNSIHNIKIPDNIKYIDKYAFSECTKLTSITIPDSVTFIGYQAFGGCRGLTSVRIPDNVTSIGDGAFWDCSGLTSITIPDSITSISDSAFSWCSKLEVITYRGTKEQWNAINKHEQWKDGSAIKTIHCTDGDIKI